MRLKKIYRMRGGSLLELILGMVVLGIGVFGILETVSYIALRSNFPIAQLMRFRTFDSILRDTYSVPAGNSYIASGFPLANNTNLPAGSYTAVKNMTISGPTAVYPSGPVSCPTPRQWATISIASPGVGSTSMTACVGMRP